MIDYVVLCGDMQDYDSGIKRGRLRCLLEPKAVRNHSQGQSVVAGKELPSATKSPLHL